MFNFKSKKIKPFAALILFAFFFIAVDRIMFYIIKESYYNFYQSVQNEKKTAGISKTEKYFYNTLILGSSRTNQGIHPFYLKKYLGFNSYKNARGGNYFKYNYYFYRYFKEKYTVPKYLIYGFDYFIFDQASSVFRMIKMNQLFGKQKKRVKRLDTDFENNEYSFFANISVLFRKKKDIDRFITTYMNSFSKVPKKSSLIFPYIGEKKTIPLKEQAKPLNWKKVSYIHYPGKEGVWLDLLLAELEKDQVHVFFVMLPDFIGTYKTNYEHEKYESDLEKIAKKYSNVSLLNFNSLKQFALSNPKLFRDGGYGATNSHLSFFGAKILNRKLCDEITRIIKYF